MDTLIGKFIELKESKGQYYVLTGREIGERIFYLATTVNEPIIPVLLRARVNNGEMKAAEYHGPDYEEILKQFSDVQNYSGSMSLFFT